MVNPFSILVMFKAERDLSLRREAQWKGCLEEFLKASGCEVNMARYDQRVRGGRVGTGSDTALDLQLIV